MALEDIFGWLAAVFTTLIFVPQIVKAYSTKMTFGGAPCWCRALKEPPGVDIDEIKLVI